MSLYAPLEDPSESGSLLDRTFERIRRNPFLRVLAVMTVLDDAAAVALAAAAPERVPWGIAATLILLSTMAWVFAVGLPTLNRELRGEGGHPRLAYVGELVEMFGRVALCAVMLLFTAALVTAVV